MAVRLQTECPEGGICVSQAVRDQVHDRLNLSFEVLGPLTLKNISRPVRAFVVREREIAPPMDPSRMPRETPARPPAMSTELEPPRPDLAPPDKPSIVVLPFQNMSADPEQEYFSDGVAEDIITQLSRSHALFVIARNSSFTYNGRAVDVKQIGRELGVRYVLEGSIRRDRERMRITAQLMEADTGNHIWAERYDRAHAAFSRFRTRFPTRSPPRSDRRSPTPKCTGRCAGRPHPLAPGTLSARNVASGEA